MIYIYIRLTPQKLKDHLYSKIKIVFSQKVFKYDKYKIKYIFKKKNNSKNLIVVFSACTRKGIKARYNYMNTLKTIDCNQLFILDDFGFDRRGAYYLGTNGDYLIQEGVISLINRIIGENALEKSIYIGSSKGGFAALYFGFANNCDYIICGAPQIFLSDYIGDERLECILGDVNPESTAYLNNILINLIKENAEIHYPSLYIHYSRNDYTYDSQIYPFLSYLKTKGIMYDEDAKSYKEHNDVSKYFPPYLNKTLNEIVTNLKHSEAEILYNLNINNSY